MKLRDICNKLEEWAPLAYQESYDNSPKNLANFFNGEIIDFDE